MERWLQIHEFPDYSVSDHGRIRNDRSQRLMALVRNSSGVLGVYLMRDGRQYQRGVAKLVAQHFLPHTDEHHSTPLHRDGDRENNHVENLIWRPRWYAQTYYRQFEDHRPPYVNHPILEVETDTLFANSWAATMHFGLIENEIARSYHEYEGRGETYKVLRRYHFRDAR